MESNVKYNIESVKTGIGNYLKPNLSIVLVQEAHSGQSFMMQLVIDRLKRKYQPHIHFSSLEQKEFEKEYKNLLKIQKSPTVLILQEERLLHLFEGLTSSREVEQTLFL